MPALLDSPPQLASTRGWGVLYPVVEEPAKPRQLLQAIPAAAAAKKQPAYSGGRKKNLETCTEALGCETGGVDSCVEAENAERKRRAREDVESASACQSARCRARGPLPPPLTTLSRGVNRVRMVHERRDGRLEVYAVRSPGVLEAERSEGRLRLRLLPLSSTSNGAAECRRQLEPEAEKEEAKEAVDDEKYGFAKYVRGGRCVERERGAVAATAVPRLVKQWETEQAAAFWVATS